MQASSQQQKDDAMLARQEEYLAARRAGSEAVLVGRETLEEVVRQGEQLENAERMAEETDFKLDKATRVLRGMTWSGWVQNMFSKELQTPEEAARQDDNNGIPSVYENAPAACRDAAQAVQNYNANLKVLSTCETDEQLETCQVICENMYEMAKTQVDQLVEQLAASQLENDDSVSYFVVKLQKDLSGLRSRQEIRKRQQEREQREKIKEAKQQQAYQKSRQQLNLSDNPKNNSYRPVEVGFNDASPETQKVLKMQDDHLDGIARHLDELGNIAINLGEASDKQSALVENLEQQSDTILDKSRMVTRRADRLIQSKAWTPAKPVFDRFVSIKHLPTNTYVAVQNGNVILQPNFDKETCVYGVWKRQGSIFGLQNKFNRRWMGQSFFGSLECRATSFGKRQEWETEKQWEKGTPLLCASAGWGSGSYACARGNALDIATAGTVSSRQADLFLIKEIE